MVQRKDKNDYIVPTGPVISGKAPNGGAFFGVGLNEFVVYNTNQIMMRYLVKVKFN